MNKFTIPSIIVLIMVVVLVPYFAQDASFRGDVALVEPVIPTLNVGAMRLDPVYQKGNDQTDTINYNQYDIQSDSVTTETEMIEHVPKGIRARDAAMEVAKQVTENTGGHLGNQAAVLAYQFRNTGTGDVIDGWGAFNPANNIRVYDELTYWVDIYNMQSFDGTGYGEANLTSEAATVSSTQFTSKLFTEFAANRDNLPNIRQTKLYNSNYVEPNGVPKPKVNTASENVDYLVTQLAGW